MRIKFNIHPETMKKGMAHLLMSTKQFFPEYSYEEYKPVFAPVLRPLVDPGYKNQSICYEVQHRLDLYGGVHIL